MRANLAAAQIDLQRRGCRHARRLEALGRADVGVASGRARPLVERVEQALHLQVGEREQVAQAAREERAAVADRRQPADQRDAHRGERVEIERGPLGRADQLRRRQAPRPRQVVDLVVALVPDARRRPSTTARRGRDTCAAGARARRPTSVTGRPDRWISAASCTPVAEAPTTRTPPSRQAIRVAVVERRELRDRRRDGGGERRHARHVAGAAGDDDASAADLAVARATSIAVVGAAGPT